jgi:hypothetical protein
MSLYKVTPLSTRKAPTYILVSTAGGASLADTLGELN